MAAARKLSRLAPAFGDIDAIAEIDPDTEQNPAIHRQRGIALGRAPLERDGATQGIDDAVELDQQTIADGLHQLAMVGGDDGLGQLLEHGLQPARRAFLIRLHQVGEPTTSAAKIATRRR